MENTEIERELYDVMHGSSEMLLPSNKWLVMLKSKLYQGKLNLIGVDEVHTVLQWHIY